MPRREDIHTILVLGSGPIKIGQAAEFDFFSHISHGVPSGGSSARTDEKREKNAIAAKNFIFNLIILLNYN